MIALNSIIHALQSIANAFAVNQAGRVEMYAGGTAPTGYLLCDGAAVSRTTYANLFAAIGTAYGAGDGSTTFNVPNFKGKSPIGYDSGDATFSTLGNNGGEKNHTLTTPEMPAHTHTLSNVTTGASRNYTVLGSDSGLNTASVTTSSTGGGGSHNNLHPYMTVNFIIKT